jgi:hypothetical protein
VAIAGAGEAVMSNSIELVGITTTPHVRAESMRYRRDYDEAMAARVQLVIRNTSPDPVELLSPTFDGSTPDALVASGEWAWHDIPTSLVLGPGALAVWNFNGHSDMWAPGRSVSLAVTDGGGGVGEWSFAISNPDTWLSAVTYLGDEASVQPNRVVFHIENGSDADIHVTDAVLYLPEDPTDPHTFVRAASVADVGTFAANGVIPAGEHSGGEAETGPLPLTYGVLRIDIEQAGRARSLWAHQRIKRESFDISGGWVNSETRNGVAVTQEAFLKTLKWLHIDTAHISPVEGYSDTELYDRYPLKYFHRLHPTEAYDTDEMLPRIHAVEFLGEPQYSGGNSYRTPQEVWAALAPYAPTRLPTTVTLSDESGWRFYAGISDYPHYDAYRVTAPAADAWRRYGRWGDQRMRWGAPLETIGDMSRSLRELSRPVPTAYWSQGVHAGWSGRDGRDRESPTPSEIRSQAYHALASRITSLYWFNLSLASIVKFPDALEELNRIGREMRLLDRFYLEGDAAWHGTTPEGDRPGWELSTIVTSDSALLFALDLDYTADMDAKEFVFGAPREATFSFPTPSYLRDAVDVFRVDADGMHDVSHSVTDDGVHVTDKASIAAVYVATNRAGLRADLRDRLSQLLQTEADLDWNPAVRSEDMDELRALLPE